VAVLAVRLGVLWRKGTVDLLPVGHYGGPVFLPDRPYFDARPYKFLTLH